MLVPILAVSAILLWVAIVLMFYGRHWLALLLAVPRRRADARTAARAKADALARLNDELASKYPLPPAATGKGPPRPGQ